MAVAAEFKGAAKNKSSMLTQEAEVAYWKNTAARAAVMLAERAASGAAKASAEATAKTARVDSVGATYPVFTPEVKTSDFPWVATSVSAVIGMSAYATLTLLGWVFAWVANRTWRRSEAPATEFPRQDGEDPVWDSEGVEA